MGKRHIVHAELSSGNVVDVYTEETRNNLFDTACEWDTYPPTEDDMLEYQVAVLPQIGQVVQRLMRERDARLN